MKPRKPLPKSTKPLKRSPLKRSTKPIARTPVKKVRAKPRPGRLKGDDLTNLREACFLRDGFHCTHCRRRVYPSLPKEHEASAHMAHIQAKRRGLDTLDNVRTLCGEDHRRQHNFGPTMEKPCPPKPKP